MCKPRCILSENQVFLQQLEEQTHNIRSIALWRLQDANLAGKFVPLLQSAVSEGLASRSKSELENISTLLAAHLRISRLDATLAEELGRCGSHQTIRKVLQYDATSLEREEEIDIIMDLQDIAGEIAAASVGFPLSVSPFTTSDVVKRLPITFDLKFGSRPNDDSVQILIHQVTSRQTAQADVGFVLWPSAVTLAHFLLDNGTHVLKGTILELGAGCGLTGLVAAKLIQQESNNSAKVILSDFNRTVLENLERNAHLNDTSDLCSVVGLDFYQRQDDDIRDGWVDMSGVRNNSVDVVLAADVICQASDAVACAQTIWKTLKAGGVAYCVCATSHHRFGVDHLEEECRKVGLDVETKLVPGDAQGSLDDLKRTSGYICGMDLTFFTMRKPTTV